MQNKHTHKKLPLPGSEFLGGAGFTAGFTVGFAGA